MWIRELATGWERVYKPSEHASASVTRGTRDAVPTLSTLNKTINDARISDETWFAIIRSLEDLDSPLHMLRTILQ
jgi:hypothetical protein